MTYRFAVLTRDDGEYLAGLRVTDDLAATDARFVDALRLDAWLRDGFASLEVAHEAPLSEEKPPAKAKGAAKGVPRA